MTFKEATQLDKFLFKLTILTICAFVSNLYLIILFAFYEKSYLFEKSWMVVNILLLLSIGGIFLYRFKLNLQTIYAAGFFAMIVLPLVWMILPIKIQQNYVGLRQTDKEGYIVEDRYCLADCKVSTDLKATGFYEERKYYSWRYAELLNRFPVENECCYKHPFDNKYLFATLLTLELTFEYLPAVFLLALILFLYEYYKRQDLKAFGEDFVKFGYDIRKVNVVGISLIIIIVLYNIAYLNVLKD